MRRMTRKKYLVAGTAVAVIASGGAAFAYWTSNGSGDGSATTGTDTPWAVTVADVDLDNLTPAGPSDTVTFAIKNDGSGVQHLSSAVASVTGTSDPGCTAADFSVSTTTVSAQDVAAGATVNGSFTVQMIDTGVNQDDCKGVTVDLEVAAS